MAVITKDGRPGTKAVLRHSHMSASKARQVLDLIRNQEVGRAAEMLRTTERSAAVMVGKVLASAVANAVHNDGQDPEDLYVSACFADESATLKRWRPRARGRATRIRKRTCHVTIVVSRLPDERLARRRAQRDAQGGGRSRRVAESRRRADLAGRLSRRRAARSAEGESATDELEQDDVDLDETGLDALEDSVVEHGDVDDGDEADGVEDSAIDADEDDAAEEDADDDADADADADADGSDVADGESGGAEDEVEARAAGDEEEGK
jgi:large subunit ribosomal protein L22